MKKSRYSDSQILVIIKQAESGVPISKLCREHGMSSASFYKWRAKYGGMKEAVEDGVTGLVVEVGDDVALESAITRLVSDAGLKLRKGEAAYRRFNELFTSEKMAAQYDDLLTYFIFLKSSKNQINNKIKMQEQQ